MLLVCTHAKVATQNLEVEASLLQIQPLVLAMVATKLTSLEERDG